MDQLNLPVSIIISAFNEQENIVECLERLFKVVPNAEILVIHGGKDETALRAENFAKKNPKADIRVIRNFGDSGKAHGIKLGISVAKHELMAQIDADLQFMPEDIPKVLQPIIDNKADITVGSRFEKNSDKGGYSTLPLRDVGNLTVNFIVSLLSGQKVTDVTAGLKAWTRTAIWKAAFKDNRFIYEMEIVLRGILRGQRVQMVPIRYHSRAAGVSGHGAGLRETLSIAITGLKIILYALFIRFGFY